MADATQASLEAKLDRVEEMMVGLIEQQQKEERTLGNQKASTESLLIEMKQEVEATRARVEELEAFKTARLEAEKKRNRNRILTPGSPGFDHRTWTQIVREHAGFRDFKARNEKRSGDIIVPMFRGYADPIDNVDSTAAASDAQRRPEWIEDPRRMTFIESLIPSFNTDKGSVEYVTEGQEYMVHTEVTVAVGGSDTTLTVTNANGFVPGQTVYVGDSTTNSATILSITIPTLKKSEAHTITLTVATGFTASKGARVWSDRFTFTAEGNYAPAGKVQFSASTASVKRLTTLFGAPYEALEDEPRLRNLLENRLRLKVLEETEWQLINGNGSGQNLTGLLNLSGISTYSWSSGISGDTQIDAIRRAMTVAHLSHLMPDTAVLALADLEKVETAKDDIGAYIFSVMTGPDGGRRPWSVNLRGTAALTAGTAIVANFAQGCEIANRVNVEISMSESHEGNFAEDVVALKARRRMAFYALNAAAIVKLTLDSAPA